MPYGNQQRNQRKREHDSYSSGSYGGQAQRARYDNSNSGYGNSQQGGYSQQQNYNANFQGGQQMGYSQNYNQSQGGGGAGMGDMYEQRMMQLLSAERRLNQLEMTNTNMIFQNNQGYGGGSQSQNRSRDDRRQNNRGRSDSRGRQSDNRQHNRSSGGGGGSGQARQSDRSSSQGGGGAGGGNRRRRSDGTRRNDGNRGRERFNQRNYDFTAVTGRLDKSGRINFPENPVKRMLQGEVLLALEDVKARIKRVGKNGKKDPWKELDPIMADNYLHGSAVYYHQKDEEGKMMYVCELYVGNFQIAVGKTDDQNRLSARQKAYEVACDKLMKLTPGECIDFSKYLGIRMFKDKDVDVAVSPYICKESNLGNLMLTREDMTPRPLAQMVLMMPENMERRSKTEILRSSCDFSDMSLEWYFFRNRKQMISGSEDRRSKVRCELFIEKKLVARAIGLHLQEAKNRVSNEACRNITKNCFVIEVGSWSGMDRIGNGLLFLPKDRAVYVFTVCFGQ